MGMKCSTLFVGAMVVLLAGCSRDAGPATSKGIDGEWQAIRMEMGPALGGPRVVEDPYEIGMWIAFKEGDPEAQWSFGKVSRQTYPGYCRIDSSKMPGEIDLRQPKSDDPNRTFQAIYKIQGDLLTINMGKERPLDFEKVDWIKLTLRRVKKA